MLAADAFGVVGADTAVRVFRQLESLLIQPSHICRRTKLGIVQVLTGAIKESEVQVLVRIIATLQHRHRQPRQLALHALDRLQLLSRYRTAAAAGKYLPHRNAPFAQ
jgi:hypothetical protein